MAWGIVLFSAGLDSCLAARLLMVQSVSIRLVTFRNPFVPDVAEFERKVRAQAGIVGCGVELVEMGTEYLDVIERPTKGYGRNLNPCIDCRIYQLKKARAMLEAGGGRFIATGEVVGQRPMSQRRQALRVMDREAGVVGLVVRPLSAKLLEESVAEREGIIERSGLLDIRGRSRRR